MLDRDLYHFDLSAEAERGRMYIDLIPQIRCLSRPPYLGLQLCLHVLQFADPGVGRLQHGLPLLQGCQQLRHLRVLLVDGVAKVGNLHLQTLDLNTAEQQLQACLYSGLSSGENRRQPRSLPNLGLDFISYCDQDLSRP